MSTYALFRKKLVPAKRGSGGVEILGGSLPPKGHPMRMMIDAMRDHLDQGDGEKMEVLKFVSIVQTPAEVAALVRKKPLWSYVLFHGEMMQINVAMPVFADGKNLDQLTAEWGPAPDGLESEAQQ